MQTTRNFSGYSLFDDIEDGALQARNRAVVCRNVTEDMGSVACKEYFNLIPKDGQMAVIGQLQRICGMV